MSGNKGPSLTGFLLGALAAGALAVLYAPFSGRELRQKVKEKISDVKSDCCAAPGQIRQNSDEAIASAISSIEEGIDRLTQAVNEAQKAADEKRRELTKGEE